MAHIGPGNVCCGKTPETMSLRMGMLTTTGSMGLGRSLARWLAVMTGPTFKRPVPRTDDAALCQVASDQEALHRAMAAANLGFTQITIGEGQDRQAVATLLRDVDSEDRARVEQAFLQAVADHASLDVEYRRIEARGGVRWQRA